MDLTLEEFGLPSDVQVWEALLLTLVSLAVGVLGGFVGLALGTMRLPALLLLGITAPVAAGTNIIVSTASALTGAVRHLRDGRVDMRIVLVMGVPSMAGAFIGGFSSQRVSQSLILLAVGLLVLWQGVEFLRRPVGNQGAEAGDEETSGGPPQGKSDVLPSNRVLGGAGAGFGVGVLGGAVGLILGSIRLPAMIRILRVDPRAAAGTNLFIGFVMGSMGWVGHVARGQVDYPLVVLMGTSAMGGSYMGARLTGRVGLDKLIKTMGLVLMVVGALLVWRGATA